MASEPDVERELSEGGNTEGEVERAVFEVDVTQRDGLGGDVVELRRRKVVDRRGAGWTCRFVGRALLEDAEAPLPGPESRGRER